MKRAPTLNDVARVAKVSRSLASLVFQDSPKVSESSRAAVLKAAEKLGYQPNESARRLKSTSTKTVGVVLTDIHNPYYGHIFYGVESSAAEYGYKLLIGNSGFEKDELNQKPSMIRDRQIETVKTIRSQMVDGLVCSSLRTSTEELRSASRNAPVILIGHTPAALVKDFDVVSTDEENAAFQILEHLTELGHKRIAYISGGTDEGPSRRTKAFIAEMKRRNLSSSASIFEGTWSQEAGYERTSEILRMKLLPTAIYAANDHIALGVLAKLREEGISVPGEMSVVGYDDSDFSRLKIADLTTMKESLFNMGRTGFELLISRIDNKDKAFKPKHLKIKPELIVRGSTGPRKKNLK